MGNWSPGTRPQMFNFSKNHQRLAETQGEWMEERKSAESQFQ